MNNKDFDDIIKGKLDHLAPTESKDIWSSFESKLDINQPVLTDNVFDQKVKDAVASHRPHFKSEHWKLMKAELVTIEERKNTIFITKALELAAIFLIVFTITQLTPYLNQDHTKKSNELYAADATNQKNSPQEKPALSQKNNNKVAQISVTTSSENKILQQKHLYAPNQTIANFESSMSDALELKDVFNGLTSHIVIENSGQDQNLDAGFQPNEQIEAINTLKINEISEDIDQPSNLSGDAFTQVYQKERNIEEVSQIENKKMTFPESEMALIIPIKPIESIKKQNIALSGWYAKDVNLINTPFDKLFSKASYNSEALNNSYGLNISFQKSDLEIQTGLAYQHKEYQPRVVNDPYGAFGDNYFIKKLNKIGFDLVTVPVNIKYHGLSGAGWSSYIMVGAALNMVANAEYDITETLVKGKSSRSYLPSEPLLDQKTFIKGIFNGDSFKNNYYASIGFGFGIEKSIYKNTSLYVQPSYFRQIISSDIGIGPNKDKIHTTSLQVGLKTILN